MTSDRWRNITDDTEGRTLTSQCVKITASFQLNMIFQTEGECYLLAMCSVKSATSLKVKGVVTQAGMEKCLSYSAHVQQWTLCFAAFPTYSMVMSPVQAQGKLLFCLSLSVEMRKNREA